jgi:mercuric ion binding protein
MIRPVAIAAVLAAILSSFPAVAGEKTVVLNVENATCALCAPIVKTALSRVSA